VEETFFRKYRVVPVLMSAFFAVLTANVTRWYMALPEPSLGQSGFAGTMLTAVAAWFKFYVESGSRGDK